MRILLASNVYPPNFIGGAELIAHEHAKCLRDLGHEVEVLAGETKPFGKHHETLEDELDGIPVHRISMLPQDYDPAFINFSHKSVESQFDSILQRFHPDVFHGHNLSGLSAALPRLAKRAGAIAVVTLHDHWGFCFKNTLLKRGERICENFTRCAECLPTIDDGRDRGIPIRMRNDFVALMLSHADALVSPSRYLAQVYIQAGFPSDTLHVIRNGIDVERFEGVRSVRSGGLRLSYIGGLYPHKGVKYLAEALGYLAEDALVTVNLVGAGDQRVHCERVLRRNNRADWVRFWGQVENRRIEDVYAETDVLVLPSICPENQPVSITEAAACGIPAIVSDLGGSAELVEDDVSGKIFRAGDSRDLARCITTFLEEPLLATRFGERARERVAPFSFETQVRRLSELYVSLRERPPAAGSSVRLVVCRGERFGRECARVMEDFPAVAGWRFVLSEWLDEELSNSSWLKWVIDPSLEPDDSMAKETRSGPLLVTTRNKHWLKDASAQECGLFYRDAAQARDCIEELYADESLHESLATAWS